jgi:hypothetical protein
MLFSGQIVHRHLPLHKSVIDCGKTSDCLFPYPHELNSIFALEMDYEKVAEPLI